MNQDKIDLQSDIFGGTTPVFPNIPPWLKSPAEKIYALHQEYGKEIVENDQYLIFQFWLSEGLEEVLTYAALDANNSDDAIAEFQEWFLGNTEYIDRFNEKRGRPTAPETIRRARQWLTSDNNYIEVSEEVRLKRIRKRQMVLNQMQD